MKMLRVWLLLGASWCAAACSGPPASTTADAPSNATKTTGPEPAAAAANPTTNMQDQTPASPSPATGHELATFGSGCFWCTEAVLEQLDGVLDVTSGYMGGAVDSPTYKQVCSGTTGHAEVVQVTFDPKRVSYDTLLEWFFRSHDPTTLNRQGADEGTQYRSAIFFHTAAQHQAALAAIEQYQPSFQSPIVTEVTAASRFWPAEDDHQDYFRLNPNAGYCRAVIAPKLKKLGMPGKR